MTSLLKRPLVKVLVVMLVLVAVTVYMFRPRLLIIDNTFSEATPQGSAGPAASFISHPAQDDRDRRGGRGPDSTRTLRIENCWGMRTRPSRSGCTHT